MEKQLRPCILCGVPPSDPEEQEYVEELGVCFVCEEVKTEELNQE